MPKRGPKLRRLLDAINLSILERALRPHYKKWEKGDHHVGRPPHNPVGLVLALTIELVRGWSRTDLVDFLDKHPEWRRWLNLKTTPDETVWSKLLDRIGQETLDRLLADLVKDLKTKGFLFLHTLAGDSTFVAACGWDPDARWGYVRRDEPRDLMVGRYHEEDGKILGYGYRLHLLVDAKREAPIAATVTRANVLDAKEFPTLFQKAKNVVNWDHVRWLALDAGFDQTDVRTVLHPYDVEAVIAPANLPKRVRRGGFTGARAKAYDKRSSVERFFAMLKSFFGLHRWGIVGLDRVRKWVTLALLTCLITEWSNHQAGRPVHSVKAFARSLN